MNAFKVVRDFEEALAEYAGAPFAVSTTSCTMALTLAVAWLLQGRKPSCRVCGWTPKTGETFECARPNCGAMAISPTISIPKRTYVGVPYAIREAGGNLAFRDEDWWGMYQLAPLPVWDSARWLRRQLYAEAFLRGGGRDEPFVCVSFHWSKTLGIQQGGAILHSNKAADEWLRRARFDGRKEGVAPAEDDFPLERSWHAYMAPETAAAGLVRLAGLPAINEPLPNDNYPDLSTLKVFQ